jgi:conjugal transfer/type IV secretion protein DotA/TraY
MTKPKNRILPLFSLQQQPASALLCLMPVVLVLFIAPAGVVGAQPATDVPPEAQFGFDPERDLEPSGGDISLQLLEGILGPVITRIRFAGDLGSDDQGAFGQMFSVFNGFMLLLLALTLFVKFVSAFLDTAHEGEALGRDRSTAWTPIRIFMSAAMLIPLVNGYCFIQVIMLWATLTGIGLADAVWSLALDKFSRTAIYAQPPPPQARELAVAMLASTICEIVVEDIPARGAARYDVQLISRNGDLGTYDERWVRWSARGLGHAACGGFIIREPHAGIDPEQDVTGIGFIDGFIRWVMSLFGFADDVRREFAGTLMAAHERVALRMREELRPLAERIIQGKGSLEDCAPDRTGGLAHAGCISLVDVAAENYVRLLQAETAVAVDQAGERAFDAFRQTAMDEGWMTAGSWFYRLIALTDYMNKLALNVPEPYPIRAWEKLPQEDVETYQHVIARLTAAISEAETDAGEGLAQGDPNNSVLDDVSRGFLRTTMDWIHGGLFGSVHPLFAISWLGHAILAAVLTAVLAGGAVTKLLPAGKLAKAAGGIADILTQSARPGGALTLTGLIVGILALALLAFALMAAIYLPLVPFIIWTVGVLHWLLLVFEALLAAPIWAVWHIRDGKGFTAEAMNGYLLLFSLLLRPTLMVFGLLGATIISYYLVGMVGGLFTVAAINAASGNITGPVIIVGLLVVFMIVAVELTVKCFSLIHRLPDFVLRWIGGAMENALDASELRVRSDGCSYWVLG